MYDKLKKPNNAAISKEEFVKWVIETRASLEGTDFVTIYETFCTGGPIVVEEEPDDGIPKLINANEIVPTGKQVS